MGSDVIVKDTAEIQGIFLFRLTKIGGVSAQVVFDLMNDCNPVTWDTIETYPVAKHDRNCGQNLHRYT